MPSTVTFALAAQLAQSLVAVTSNSRVSEAAVRWSTSSAFTCTFVDSGGSCSPSSSLGWYVRAMPESRAGLSSWWCASVSSEKDLLLTPFSTAMIWLSLVTATLRPLPRPAPGLYLLYSNTLFGFDEGQRRVTGAPGSKRYQRAA